MLSEPLSNQTSRDVRWREIAAHLHFESRHQFIGAEVSRNAPGVAAIARSGLLSIVYRDDYHTDVFDIARLRKRVASGAERIVFWGATDSIATLRRWMTTGYEPTSRDLRGLDLGTATTLPAPSFGPGYLQMARTGSTSASVAATGPILKELRQVLEHRSALVHTLAALPRNRTSCPGLRGGAAIARLHAREIGSAFWGVAPFHVMQGGNLEILDYRELYFCPQETIAIIERPPCIYLEESSDRNYADALYRINNPDRALEFGAPRVAESTVVRFKPRERFGSQMRYEALVFGVTKGAGISIHEMLSNPEFAGCAALAVYLPIDESHSSLQRLLTGEGFALTMIVPPKNQLTQRWVGVWVRPRSKLPIAAPYYLNINETRMTEVEKRVVDRVRSILTQWNT